MSYIINKTDGSILTEIVDGNIDQTSSDLTLIGKNASTYGEAINENFVYLLENFANTSSPNNPITGQLWYDTSDTRLKVYDGSGFKVTGGTIVSNTLPSQFGQGDIWIDSSRQQMFFNDGVNTLLAGPPYSAEQGVSGFLVTDILDVNGLSHTIVLLYVAEVLIGIYSKDYFLPRNPIDGFSTEENIKYVDIGFNIGNYAGISFDIPVVTAESLINQDGEIKTADEFVVKTGNSDIYGALTIKNDIPLVLGTGQSNTINVSTSLFQIQSNNVNQNFEITTLNSGGSHSSLFIDAENKQISFYKDLPSATAILDVNGNAIIRGNLTVEGTATTISTVDLSIEDKNIILGSVTTPTNTTANGGGITLKGATDKTLNWVSATSAWTSSEHFNIASGKSYYVNGVQVLSGSALGSAITSAPGLTSIGLMPTLSIGTVTSGMTLTSNSISFTGTGAAGNVILVPKGTGTVDVSSKKITSVADPVANNDAANLKTVIKYVTGAPLGLSVDITNIISPDTYIPISILNKIFPLAEHADDTFCRILCSNNTILSMKIFKLINNGVTRAWTWVSDEPI